MPITRIDIPLFAAPYDSSIPNETYRTIFKYDRYLTITLIITEDKMVDIQKSWQKLAFLSGFVITILAALPAQAAQNGLNVQANSEKIQLALDLSEGDHFVYEDETQLNLKSQILEGVPTVLEIPVDIAVGWDLKVESVLPDGSYRIALKAAHVKLKVEIMGQQYMLDSTQELSHDNDLYQLNEMLKAYLNYPISLFVNSNGRVVKVEGVAELINQGNVTAGYPELTKEQINEINTQSSALLSSYFSEVLFVRFPDNPVAVGASWEENIDLEDLYFLTVNPNMPFFDHLQISRIWHINAIDAKSVDISYLINTGDDAIVVRDPQKNGQRIEIRFNGNTSYHFSKKTLMMESLSQTFSLSAKIIESSNDKKVVNTELVLTGKSNRSSR